MTVVLTCGDAGSQRWATGRDAVGAVADAVEVVNAPVVPGRAEVDPLLDRAGRLVVVGGDAALAGVLVRLLRRERLDVAVAFVPDPASEAAAVWGVPAGVADAVDLAVEGAPRPAVLVRDDRGGVVVGAHRLGAFTGAVYADERLVVRGSAAGMVVRPDPDGEGVTVTVTGRPRWQGLRPGPEHDGRGRAVQVGCRPAVLVRDGITDDRSLERRSWYRHEQHWRLVRP